MVLVFNMKKYLKIYKAFFANALSYDAHYRKDTWLYFGSVSLWLLTLAGMIEVFFAHTNALGGWSKEEVYLLTIVWVIIDEMYTMFFKKNMLDLANKITDGQLDLVITKPASSMFLVSTPIFLMRGFYRLLVQLALLGYVVMKFDFAVSAYHVAIGIILSLCGLFVHYSIGMLLNTLAFWFLRVDNVNDLWNVMNSVGTYPVTIFPRIMQILTYTVIPIALIGYGQVATVTGKWGWELVLYLIGFTILLFLCARSFWYFAIKRYSSASS